MRKTRLFKRSVPLWTLLLTCAILISAAVAAVVFITPTVTHQMTLGASNTLEFYTASVMNNDNPPAWNLVPVGGSSLNWGIFAEDEGKIWWLKVKNTGNVAGNVSWRKTGWDIENGKWELSVQVSAAEWAEGVTKPLAVGAEIKIMLYIHELTATPGIAYSFGVYIENNDAPLP